MANTYFNFKRFTIHQQSAAMKVGTDGVLLGAWCRVEECQRRILDIGTGTGVIALMLAQRSENFAVPSTIEAIEIDFDSFVQTTENVSISIWESRIRPVHSSLQDFDSDTPYDHIVSNPPYFNNSLTSPDASRTKARHTGDLSYSDLACGVDRLLAKEGLFSVIIPCSESAELIAIFERCGFFVWRTTNVFPRADKPAKRVLLEFGRQPKLMKYATLVIETDVRHEYTDDYRSLTKDFYPNR